MNPTQNDKALRFRALHAGPGAFVMPNPWDAGSAACSPAWASRRWQRPAGPRPARSAGATADHARGVARARPRDRRGDRPAGVGRPGERLRRRARGRCRDDPPRGAIGLVGGSIEDATGRADEPLYAPDHAAERVAAAAEAARASGVAFTLTRAPRTSCAAVPTWTTRSAASRPTSGRRRRAVRAGPARPRRRAHGVRVAGLAGQLHGRDPRPVVLGRRTAGGRRPAHQPRDVAVSRGDDGLASAARGSPTAGPSPTSTGACSPTRRRSAPTCGVSDAGGRPR